ncbi:hypothetical protein NEOCIP111885_01609 [Pseudoneobacillus rhizosphaerae]|uniref:Uncharacterized protein n=1 Tax=Pseudoneobacillus rhizosphaerae TaxID=2880968 RepID=A0A9C7LAD2_9BACI|nr:hypothetical protein NEOCIP111885_01609 [Pseudoneobacillus rhizosphaerae]
MDQMNSGVIFHNYLVLLRIAQYTYEGNVFLLLLHSGR